ncbi:iron complex transport system substrate-binding protein [Halobacillus karajensis]|uniref:cobalamin-binding protein n=1 Tax=Halobacillus karajensis TaxID=195088 RepID=UPI0008A77BA5|nr:cobalamin-binding protein [Halobacillus karajensis]SEH95712.1 iron complex transport system substrate-binding protein [Halobacillus karajensis]
MRIVSICPSNTEIVAYLGQTQLLVGVDNYSDYPQEVEKLTKVGPDLSIDMEKVAALKPDLVLASLSVPGMEKNIEGLDEYELPYIILNPNSLYEISEDIRRVGRELGMREEGEQKADEFLEDIDKIRQSSKNVSERPSLYWEWWPKPVFTPGKLNWLNEISELAGGRNLFEDQQVASFQTDWEEVKSRNPDHICMVWVGVKEEKMNPDLVKSRQGWSEIHAVKNNQIHVLEESLFCRPSPRLLKGLRKIQKVMEQK